VSANAALERLIALDGRRVWAAIVRGSDAAVIRSGTLRLFEPECDVQLLLEVARAETFARIVDADGLPIVAVRGGDDLSAYSDLLSAELRPGFRVDILDRAFAAAAAPDTPLTYADAARELAAELEAGFRSALLLQPQPLLDRSVRFAVGHAAATLYPDGADAVRLVCVASEVRFEQQFTTIYAPRSGPRYALDARDVMRLGTDIRAFVSNQRARFSLVEP
jgi:hypothetical protein